MPIDINQRETSTSPLAVAKSAGDELATIDVETSGQSEPLDATAGALDPTENSAEENEKQKNPLGYTVTSPTESEIEALTDTDGDETEMEPKAY